MAGRSPAPADLTEGRPLATPEGGSAQRYWRMTFARSATGTFGLRIFDAGVTVLITLLLARMLGAAGFGVFSYALAWAALLGVPAMLGLEQLVVRGVAAAAAQRADGRVRGMVGWSIRTIAIVSVVCALTGGVFAALAGLIPPGGELALWIAMLLVPLTALARVMQAAIRGLEHVVAGFLSELALMPILSLVFVGFGAALFGQEFDAAAAVGAHVLAAIVGLAGALWLLARHLPGRVREALPVTHPREWLAAAMPLLFITGAHVVNRQTDVVMLGALEGVAAAGVYAVAARGVQLITFVTYAVHAPLAPRVAALYATSDKAALQRVLATSARVILGASIPLAILFALLGPWLLSLFGEEFVAGFPALVILSAGQLAAAVAGPAGLALMMTNHERVAAVGTGIGATVNVVLNLLLIPQYGLTGAATATAAATGLTSVIHIWMVRRRLGINATAFWRGR
ncbi:flippase [soil metagenome]